MSEWLSGMGAGVANHLWQSTVFAVVAWGAALLLRKNQARVRYGLWVASSVKFLVPFSLLIGLGGMLPRPQHAVVTMPVYSAADEVGLPFSDVTLAPASNPTLATMKPSRRWGAQVTWPVGLAGLWLCGVVVVLGVWCGGWRKVTWTLRRAVRTEAGREVAILRRVEASMGVRRRVRLALSREWMEPGMFGIRRPVLIWPEGLSARLDDEHIEAIVAHELMHAQRRDNLTAALHMLVEAAFWFHPLVWWMERRMVEERERACDEAVVEMGSRPGVYAESLLKAVRFCVESPLVCVAGVTGADLTRRVRSIMTLRLRRLGVAGKVGLGALAFAAIAGPVAFGVVRMIPVYGQILHATGPLPSYEVVVIKPSQEGARGASTEGEETHYLMTAKMLIQFAYGIFNPPKVMDLNVVGGPDWINNDVFSIVGKMDSAEFEQEQKLGRGAKHERRQLMEQSLLAERFKLKMHTETRDVPVYELTVIKGGPKMAPAKDVTGGAHVNPSPGSMAPEELKRGLIVQAKGRNFVMTVKGMTLDMFVDALGAQKETAGKQVVNQTGLTAAYDFTLTWGPEDSAGVDNGSNEVIEPPLFTAIQQQLGLKLAEGKGPAEVVVIDHIEKPVLDSAAEVAKPSVVAAAVVRMVPASFTQSNSAPLAFEVATVKPSAPENLGRLGMEVLPGGHVKLTNFPLYWLVEAAYDVPYLSPRMTGGPDWMHTVGYDIEAKAPEGSVPADLPVKERDRRVWLMMQNLLKERFKLSVRQEVKDVPVYSLVVDKNGPKLTPSKATEQECVAGKRFDSMGCHEFNGGQGRGLHGTAVNMADTVEFVEHWADRPVIDNTGLTGLYAIDTEGWTSMRQMAPRDPNAGGGDEGMSDPLRPTLFTIFQGLGLKLESSHAPVEVYVIDHVERPSEN